MKRYSYRMLSMPHANAHVEFVVDNFSCLTNIRLYSYSTMILDLELNRDSYGGVLTVCYRVDCSATTARHVNRFTIELFGENKYHELKKLSMGSKIECKDTLFRAVEMNERYVYNGKVYY